MESFSRLYHEYKQFLKKIFAIVSSFFNLIEFFPASVVLGPPASFDNQLLLSF